MKSLVLWSFWGVVLLLVAGYFALPVDGCSPGPFAIYKSISETRQVAFAAIKYAGAHEGRLPKSLQELVPEYLSATFPLKHLHLANPGVALAELPPEAVVVFVAAKDERRGAARVIIGRADGSCEQLP